MKILLLLVLLCFSSVHHAQTKHYRLFDTQTGAQHKVKDSAAAVRFLDSLVQHNYYFATVKLVETDHDTIRISFDKGNNYNQAFARLDDETAGKLEQPAEIFTNNLDSLKRAINSAYAREGYAFSRVQSLFQGMQGPHPAVRLQIQKGARREVNRVVFQGYERVPARFRKNIEKEYLGTAYTESMLRNITASMRNHEFFLQEKAPQTLFTRDSTNVYVFLKKKKANSFDGVIGFGNDERERFTLNGSLDVKFRNMFNGFEALNIFWQRNPDRAQTFDIRANVPYLFGSNVGTDVRVQIFRQDSTYANVKLAPSLYLHLNAKHRVGLRGTFETSAVLDSLYSPGRDFSKSGVGSWYEFTSPTDVELFVRRTAVRVEADYFTVAYTENKSAQTRLYAEAEHNFHLSGNHYLNARAAGAAIQSRESLASNEMLRFGGWNSFRGFNENSLYADSYYFASSEYRYLIGEQAFFDVFAQYGGLRNRTLGVSPKLYSIGTGFNFFIPIGLMSFQISNGSEFGNPVKFSETKIHWGLLSRF